MSGDRLQRYGLATLGAYAVWKTADYSLLLSQDVALIRKMLKWDRGYMQRGEHYLVADNWTETAKKYATKECLVFEDKVYTYEQVDTISNHVGNWASSIGIKAGDVVALMMENRPEFVMTWLGLTKIGAIIALINTNIRGRPLVHSIKVAGTRHILVGSELYDVVKEVSGDLGLPVTVVGPFGKNSSFGDAPTLDPHSSALSATPIDPALRKGITAQSAWGYIYTSGTTGLPKACVITHNKYRFSWSLFYSFGVKDTDRLYTSLPLFHSAGGMLGIGSILHGCTVVLRRKFSLQQFWPDCIKYRVTVIQYIGELCRYLLNLPPTGFDNSHRVRLAIGNGLRPEIWPEFQTRFNIAEIGEFYGATEGNGALINHCTDPSSRGAVGRFGWLARKLSGTMIVKFNVESETPIRGPNGFCQECAPGEVGELLIKIDEKKPFMGYTDEKSSKKKIYENVLKAGDKWFSTGDLLRRESSGYYYFVDRIGDTFRWKGENVSTMEVSEVVSAFPGILEANIYGVQIEGLEGRACMAALCTEGKIDATEFTKYVQKNLPAYAIPLFVRFLPEMDITGTFKHRKGDLQKEGFNPDKVNETMWWYNDETKSYDILNEAAHSRIVAGKAKL